MARCAFRVKFTARCDSAERNNGINKLLFTYRGGKQDQPVYGNFLRHWGTPVRGMTYWIEVYPAFPTDDAREQTTRRRIKSPRRNASPSKSGRKTMSKVYQGKPVSVVRDARAGDVGFDATKDQVWVRNADGSENVAPRKDVTDA